MEKSSRTKAKFFSFIAAGATPISPVPEKRPDNRNKFTRKAFSGPIFSIVPAEARRKSRNGSFDAAEPTSPKVSCMGQVKHKHNKLQNKNQNQSQSQSQSQNQNNFIVRSRTVSLPPDFHELESSSSREAKKKPTSAISRIFRVRRSNHNSDGISGDCDRRATLQVQGKEQQQQPSLGQMKRFASGRDSLANFDWTA